MEIFSSLLFPVLILLLFVPIFLSGRRQRRQAAEMQALQASLEPGDVVMTTSGLRATVVDASYEETVDLEVADGVVTTWVRAAVRERVAPAADTDHADVEVPDDAAALHETTTGSADRPSLDKTSLDKPALDKPSAGSSAGSSSSATATAGATAGSASDTFGEPTFGEPVHDEPTLDSPSVDEPSRGKLAKGDSANGSTRA